MPNREQLKLEGRLSLVIQAYNPGRFKSLRAAARSYDPVPAVKISKPLNGEATYEMDATASTLSNNTTEAHNRDDRLGDSDG